MTVLPPDIVLKVLHVSAAECEDDWIKYLMGGIFDSGAKRYFLLRIAWEDNVFVNYIDYEEDLSSRNPQRIAPYSWIRLTHVCRMWRELALYTSALWTHVSATSREAVAEVLQRSKDKSLTLTSACPTQYQDYLVTEIFAQNIHRISVAVLPALPNSISEAQVRSASQLETLIFVEACEPMAVIANHGHGIAAPYQFPILKHLETVPAIWESFARFFSSSLTSLILRYPRADHVLDDLPPYAHSSRELALALRHTPLLEVLDVDVGEDTNAVSIKALLPRLRRLGIRGATECCAALFNALQIPSGTQIKFDCKNSIGADIVELSDATCAIFEAIDPFTAGKGSTLRPILSLSIISTRNEYRLRGWRSVQRLEESPHRVAHPDVIINLPVRSLADNVSALLLAMPLPQPYVVRLGSLPLLNIEEGTSQSDIIEAVAALPNLSALIMDRLAAHLVCQLIKSVQSPSLRIFLSGVRFRDAMPTLVGGVVDWDDMSVYLIFFLRCE